MFSSKDPTTADDKISQSNIEEAKASSAGSICELAQFTIVFFDWLRNWREMSQPIKRKILASTWDERRKSIHLYLKHGIAAVMKCKCSRYHNNS